MRFSVDMVATSIVVNVVFFKMVNSTPCPNDDQSSTPQSTDKRLLSPPRTMREVCLFLRAKEEISMARNVGQIIARGDRWWLIRVYLGRDRETCRWCESTAAAPKRNARSDG